jgi:hypothetical protein
LFVLAILKELQLATLNFPTQYLVKTLHSFSESWCSGDALELGRCREKQHMSYNFVLRKTNKPYYLVICVSKQRELQTVLI